MALTGATKTTLEGILKEYYLPICEKQFYEDSILTQLIEKNTKEVEGTEAVFSMHLAGSLGVKYTGETGALPTAGKQTVAKTRVPLSYLHGRLEVSLGLIKASKSNGGSFVRGLSFEMKSLVNNMKRQANIFSFLDGSGALAQCETGTASNTIVVDRWCPLFEVGRVLDSFTAKTGGSQNMDSKTITAVDEANLSMTVASHGASVGDYVFIEDTRGLAQMGLLGIADDATLVSTIQGLSRATYPILKGKRLHNNGTGRNISEGLLMDGIATLRKRGHKPDVIVGTPYQMNDICKALQTDRRFVNPQNKLKGAIWGVDINNVPFTDDPDCPAGYTFMLSTDHLNFHQAGGLDWMDEGTGILTKVSGYPAVEAVLYLYRELSCKLFAAQLRIEDLNENVPTGA